MYTHKILAAIAALAVAPATTWAQPRIVVETEVMNVGEVLYQQPRRVVFNITNRGADPLRISRIHPSCGCTTVEWPREDVAPGASTQIVATYDAQQLGSFQKELEVYTNAAPEPVYLTLQGRVVDHATDYTGTFPIDMGAVRLSTNVVEFDDVNRGDRPVAVVQVVNTSKGSYRPQLMHLPTYLSATYEPEQLAGGRVGRILLTLDSEKLKSYGLTQTSVYLARHMGDKVSAANEISVSALLLPDFSGMSIDDAHNAPQLTLSADSLDFSPLADKTKATQTLLLTNAGRRPLNIRSVQVYGKVLGVSLSNRVVAPGAQVKLKVSVNRKFEKLSKSRPRVLLISDDPQRPKTVINVKL
ncbi:MAG: DUF1573 domain-containing protein [Bacteroidaceae bacterium]|nr:DUF1573 domain-containing protein [Bacteroidaceae bacterium]